MSEERRGATNPEIEVLLPAVYDDVSAHLYPVAGRSLLAHLIKLKEEGRVSESQGNWRAV